MWLIYFHCCRMLLHHLRMVLKEDYPLLRRMKTTILSSLSFSSMCNTLGAPQNLCCTEYSTLNLGWSWIWSSFLLSFSVFSTCSLLWYARYDNLQCLYLFVTLGIVSGFLESVSNGEANGTGGGLQFEVLVFITFITCFIRFNKWKLWQPGQWPLLMC